MKSAEIDFLKETLKAYGIESTSALNLFVEDIAIEVYPRNQIIFSEGKKDESEYVLLDGVLHRYNIKEDGQHVTTGFYMGRCVITPNFARHAHNKSIFSLQTLTEVKIAHIGVKALDHLRYNNEEIRGFGQKVLEGELIKNLSEAIDYRSLTAKERLNRLRKNFPNLENLIPHAIIASYLGITHVSFSRLRSEKSKK